MSLRGEERRGAAGATASALRPSCRSFSVITQKKKIRWVCEERRGGGMVFALRPSFRSLESHDRLRVG